MGVIARLEHVYEQVWKTKHGRVIKIALEVHLWSVPYGLVMVVADRPRHLHHATIERRSKDTMGTTPPPSVSFTTSLVQLQSTH